LGRLFGAGDLDRIRSGASEIMSGGLQPVLWRALPV